MNKKTKMWLIVGSISTAVLTLALGLGLGLGLNTLRYRARNFVDDAISIDSNFRISKDENVRLIEKYKVSCASTDATRVDVEKAMQKLLPTYTLTDDYEDIAFQATVKEISYDVKVRCWNVES